MTSPPVGVERRVGQRFNFNLAVSLRNPTNAAEGLGFTQDLSSRGAYLFTDMQVIEGAEIELTLKMPSEITLGENMPVRCRGRVLRIARPGDSTYEGWVSGDAETKSSGTKIGVAVCLSEYEYLTESLESPADFRRIAALHTQADLTTNAIAVPLINRLPSS